MFIAEVKIENFRMFGEGEDALVVPLKPGVTALVGENDSGKTAVIDALRFALGTRDQEFFRVEETDFHQPPNGTARRQEMRIRCKFESLTGRDKAAFAEYLTYEERGDKTEGVLYVTWKAAPRPRTPRQRAYTSVEVRSGAAGDGPPFDPEARNLLRGAYLRPLRDAERAMSAGRGSRLSQILQHTKEIQEHGESYDTEQHETLSAANLSVVGIGDYANALLEKHKGVRQARGRLNDDYLKQLSFRGGSLEGQISVAGSKGDESVRLRQLLEKLDLELHAEGAQGLPPNRGLGSNNLLFMACELLLLGSEEDGFPLLLVEEPEAHLHPQRQLRLMQFIQRKAGDRRADGQQIQVIVTTHSPNLASAIELDNLVLLESGRAFSLAHGLTELSEPDYGFLKRFLDVTKANLFFARGLLIVEGDAERLLLPTLARLIGREFTENGVSIVSVGGTGLRRFARIYLRKDPDNDGTVSVPVACIADLDVMPDCAPEILGRIKPGDELPEKSDRRWRVKSDFKGAELDDHRCEIRKKAAGQNVETFVADEWTLEYDLAFSGLGEDVWIAAHLAKNDVALCSGKKERKEVVADAKTAFDKLSASGLSPEQMASEVYALFERGSTVSKPTAAQYLAELLEEQVKQKTRTAADLRALLPQYLIGAIDYVTREGAAEAVEPQQEAGGQGG